jgi:hypothetical protein
LQPASDAAVGLISGCGAGLKSLHISGFSGLTADGFALLAAMPRLRRLVFRNAWLSADRIAPLGAAAVAPGGPRQRLRSLQLEHCTGVDEAAAGVLARLPWLARLVLRDCPDLAEPAVLALAAAPRLGRLEIINCAKVSPGARAAARRARGAACDAAAAARRGGRGGGGGGGGGGRRAPDSSDSGASGGGGAGVLGLPDWAWPAVPDCAIDVVWDGGGTSSGDGGSW